MAKETEAKQYHLKLINPAGEIEIEETTTDKTRIEAYYYSAAVKNKEQSLEEAEAQWRYEVEYL